MALLVGRAGPLAAIEATIGEALRGSGRMVLISGEAGIGKSRLVEAVADQAASRGMPVARGYAIDDPGAPPLWPWLRLGRDQPELLPALETSSAHGHGGVQPPVQQAGSQSDLAARFQMFVDVADQLRRFAKPRGLLVILEDLHWADRTSVLLLRHLAAELTNNRLLVAVTFRAPPAGPLAELLPDLLRGNACRPVRLTGLDAHAVATWLRSLPGTEGWEAVAARLRDRTGGNPLLIRLITESLPHPGPDADGTAVDRLLTERSELRGLVTARIDTLSEAAREIIVAAAVLAERIQPNLLAAMTDRPTTDVMPLLAEAVTAGVLRSGTSGLAFGHALVRDAVYADLLPTVRADLHRRAGLALEALDDPAVAGPVASHWRLAAGGDAPRRCLTWAQRAAGQARAAFAHDEAVEFAALAVACADPAGAEPGERAQLMIDLADAQFAANLIGDCLESCSRAADLAERADSAELLAMAALVVQGVGGVDVYRIVGDLCRRALDRRPKDNSPIRARLLAQVAVASAEAETGRVAQRLAAAALAVAEQSGDSAAILAALAARHLSITVPDTIDERRLLADRAIELGEKSDRPMAALWGHLWRIAIALQLGDISDFDAEVAVIDQIARRTRSPIARWHHDSALALRAALIGDFPAARTHIGQARVLAERMGDLSTVGMAFAFLGTLAVVRGDPSAVPPGAMTVLRSAPQVPLVKVTIPILLSLKGDREAAIAAFEEFRDLPARVPVGTRWAGIVGQIGTAAVMLEDAEVAADVYRLLLPSAPFCQGDGSGSVFSRGSNAGLLGELAHTAGRYDEALRHFSDAVAVNARIGARPFVAMARLGWAASLRARVVGGSAPSAGARAAADLALADQLVRQAAAEFRRLDMPGPLTRAVTLQRHLSTDRKAANPLSDRESEVARLLAGALTNKEIAERLFLSERTIESHVRSILAKLGFTTRTEVATWIVRSGSDVRG